MIYVDHNATTPLSPEALDAMRPWLGPPANASSVHRAGQRARAVLDETRETLAEALSCRPGELVFTSGGTEADNLALRGVMAGIGGARRKLLVGATEHAAVLDTAKALERQGFVVERIPVDARGVVRVDLLETLLDEAVGLVSVMWANNETGAINPINDIYALCRRKQVRLHVDAVQAFGRLPIDVATTPVDLLSVSAHKLYGPQGAGALFVRPGTPFGASVTGGHQERGRRAGTENVAAIAGFGAATSIALRRIEEDARHTVALRDALEEALTARIPELVVVGREADRLGNTSCVCIPGATAETLLTGLDLAGICASSGSACSSGSLEPSHVLLAMGIAPELARCALRFSFGRGNTSADVERIAAVLPGLVEAARAAGA